MTENTYGEYAAREEVEERFTLDEARRILERRECLREGHDLRQPEVGVLCSPTRFEPHAVCERCGARFEEVRG